MKFENLRRLRADFFHRIINLSRKEDKNFISYFLQDNPHVSGLGFSHFPSCNLRCDYCYLRDFSKHLLPISKKIFNETLSNLDTLLKSINLDPKGISISFMPLGEAMLFQDFLVPFIEKIYFQGIKIKQISFLTNGTIPFSNHLFDTISFLKDKNVEFRIGLSFDGNSEINFRNRGIGFERILPLLSQIQKLGLSLTIYHTWTPIWKNKEKRVVEFLFKNFPRETHVISIKHQLGKEFVGEYIRSLKRIILFSKLYGLSLYYKWDRFYNYCKLIDKVFFHYPYVSNCPFYSPYLYEGLARFSKNVVKLKTIHNEIFRGKFFVDDHSGEKSLKLKDKSFYLENFEEVYKQNDFAHFCKNCPLFKVCKVKFCPFVRTQLFKDFCEFPDLLNLRFFEEINFDKGLFPLLSQDSSEIIFGFETDLTLKNATIIKMTIEILRISLDQLEQLLFRNEIKERIKELNDSLFVFITDLIRSPESKFLEFIKSISESSIFSRVPLLIWYPQSFKIPDALKENISKNNVFLIPQKDHFFKYFVNSGKVLSNSSEILDLQDVNLSKFPILD